MTDYFKGVSRREKTHPLQAALFPRLDEHELCKPGEGAEHQHAYIMASYLLWTLTRN